MEFPPAPESSRASSDVPFVTAAQASALLKSGLAISNELIGAAFPEIAKTILDELSGKWDFDVGSPLVQRHLAAKLDDLHHTFMARLQETQDQYFHEVTVGRAPAVTGALDAETLSLVDSISVESNTVVERHASKIAGYAEQSMRDLNLVVAFLLGRSAIRNSENPLGPAVYVRALLRAAEDTDLHKEAWEFFLTVFEKPLGEELARVVRQLLDHYANHGVDVRAIRRTRAAPKSATPWQTGAGGGNAAAHASNSASALAEAGGPHLPAASGQARGQGAAPGPDEPNMLLGGLLTRLQANARGSRLPHLPSHGPAPQQLLESIGEFQQMNLQELGPSGNFAVPTESIGAMRDELISKSTRVVDKLTIELVGMLFDHVMQDKQVPSEIKARISRLQFPVLKSALMDAAFFASSAHPARKLIDRIAGTSAGWEPYGDDNQRYLKEVDRVITEILKHFETDLGVFERLYGEFDKFVSDIAPEENDPVSRAKKALEAAEKHEILTINTTIQVRRAFERVDLEPYIKEFLLGAWVKVLVSATVRSGENARICESVPRCHSRAGVVSAAESEHRGSQQACQAHSRHGACATRRSWFDQRSGARPRIVFYAADGIARDGGQAGRSGDLHQVKSAGVRVARQDRWHAAVGRIPGNDSAGWHQGPDQRHHARGRRAQGRHLHARSGDRRWTARSGRRRTRAGRNRPLAARQLVQAVERNGVLARQAALDEPATHALPVCQRARSKGACDVGRHAEVLSSTQVHRAA